jgi:hypothetical protein
MRSRGIQAGDVVQVVKDCCGHYVGLVYTVRAVEFVGGPVRDVLCGHCGWRAADLAIAWAAEPPPRTLYVAPVAWLRKFAPPAESVEEINRLWEPKRETLKVPVRLYGRIDHDPPD